MAFVAFQDVGKIYKSGEVKVQALRDATFQVEKGELCVIVGPSGAGKTTLLNILGGMDTLTSGKVFLDGAEVSAFNKRQLTAYRRQDVGFVFQFYNLIPTLTALENVELVRDICPGATPAVQALEQVGLLDHKYQFPSQLSGGEQQRVSIARAVSKNPKMLLCDEPTGALDSETGVQIQTLLQNLSRQQEKTVIIVTHNTALAEAADKVIRLKNGKIRDITVNAQPKAVSEVAW